MAFMGNIGSLQKWHGYATYTVSRRIRSNSTHIGHNKWSYSRLCYLVIWIFMSLSTHCIGNITTGSFMRRGNQYIQLVKVLYCKLPTNGKQLPTFPLETGPGTKPRS